MGLSHRITGTVFTHDGAPAKEAHISVWCPRVHLTHECDDQGRFEVFLAERGSVSLSISAPEHAQTELDVEVGTLGLECVLVKASKVTVTLTGFVPDDYEVLLIGKNARGNEILHAVPRYPDSPGSFSFDWLSVGTYRLELNSEWAELSGPMTVSIDAPGRSYALDVPVRKTEQKRSIRLWHTPRLGTGPWPPPTGRVL